MLTATFLVDVNWNSYIRITCQTMTALITSWAASEQNQQNGTCAQRRLRSTWASAQSDQSSLSAWRKLGPLATHWAHSEDSDQTGWMPRLIWVFAGRTVILLVLSRGGSFMHKWQCHLIRLELYVHSHVNKYKHIKSFIIVFTDVVYCMTLWKRLIWCEFAGHDHFTGVILYFAIFSLIKPPFLNLTWKVDIGMLTAGIKESWSIFWHGPGAVAAITNEKSRFLHNKGSVTENEKYLIQLRCQSCCLLKCSWNYVALLALVCCWIAHRMERSGTTGKIAMVTFGSAPPL